MFGSAIPPEEKTLQKGEQTDRLHRGSSRKILIFRSNGTA